MLGAGWKEAWASEQRGGARPAACSAPGCGARFALGELRLSPGGRRPSYYHPTCVEKLPPPNTIKGIPTLGADARAEAERVFGTHAAATSCVPAPAPGAMDDTTHHQLQVYVPTAANIPDKFYTSTVDARMAVLRRIAASRGTAAAGPP